MLFSDEKEQLRTCFIHLEWDLTCIQPFNHKKKERFFPVMNYLKGRIKFVSFRTVKVKNKIKSRPPLECTYCYNKKKIKTRCPSTWRCSDPRVLSRHHYSIAYLVDIKFSLVKQPIFEFGFHIDLNHTSVKFVTLSQ